jgi:hypothetical protein
VISNRGIGGAKHQHGLSLVDDSKDALAASGSDYQ